MADKTQLEVLKHGVTAWNAWRAAHEDLCPDLTAAHLLGLDLIGANFAKADLRKTDLRGSNLSDGVLVDAKMTSCGAGREIVLVLADESVAVRTIIALSRSRNGSDEGEA